MDLGVRRPRIQISLGIQDVVTAEEKESLAKPEALPETR